MKVGVCELPSDLDPESSAWKRLTERVSRETPDLFLLNEMPFGPWIAAAPSFDAIELERSREAHERGLEALPALGARVVAGSRPNRVDDRRVNEAFLWTNAEGASGVHTKQFFPDEEGYFEARWFEAGERHFRVAEASGLEVGFLICTELMFNEYARRYGREGAQVILVPRAVGSASLPRWLVALRMAAIVSGCYVLSSNRAGRARNGQEFGGRGWIVDPMGELIAETTSDEPFAFHALDLDLVTKAQADYPCYVAD